MGKKNNKKGKSNPSSQNISFTGGTRRGSNSSAYAAVPVQTSDSDTSIQNQASSTRLSSSISLKRKPSPVIAPLSTLEPDEFDFFSMVSSGDVQGVMKYLSSPDFKMTRNINRFNINGYTALHMAVRRQDEEMVNILLKTPKIQMNVIDDLILHAVREDNLEITKLLLKVQDDEDGSQPNVTNQTNNNERNKSSSISSKSGISTSIRRTQGQSQITNLNDSSNTNVINTSVQQVNSSSSTNIPKTKKDIRDDIPFDSEFHEVITAFMLSAQIGSTQLMELFYNRGDRLETPALNHNLNCDCDICGVSLIRDGDMTRVHKRYHLYKALCQPEYICFMAQKLGKDPVNYAIDKIVKLRHIMKKDPAYDQMYVDFIEELEKFCTDMLGLCRTTDETKIFLSPKDTEGKERLPHLYPRLWYTTGLDMKSFVAHPNTQNVVYHMWATDRWSEWESYGTLFRLFNLSIRVVAFPLIALILIVADGTKLGKALGSPIGRFLNYVASYIVFLVLVTFQVVYPYQRCNDVHWLQVNDDSCKKRGPPNMGTEWPIIIYVLSFCASALKRQSVSWFWKMKWNWYDVVFILSFLCTFACWMSSWVWTQMPENQPYISALERLLWPQNGGEVLGECFLAIATMLSYGRLLRFLEIFENVGPLQVILGNQITAFLSTAFMFFIVLFAYGSALLALYVPYKEYQGLDDHHQVQEQDGEFCEVKSIIPHLVSHLIDPSPGGGLLTWDIKINETTVEEVHHYITQFTGKLIYVSYHIIGFLMMYNMLTGYFGQTMGDILSDSDRVWKFTRTELYLTHIKDTVLPPPFNLIPTLKTLKSALKYFTLLGKTDDPKAACSFRQCCYITEGEKTKEWKTLEGKYRELILNIICRYYKLRKDVLKEEQATRDDVLEIGEEIAELKEKLRDEGKVGSQDDSEDSEDDDFNNFPRNPQSKWTKARSISPSPTPSSQVNNPSAPTSPVNNPVITSQPTSPQPGTSGVTTINMSPIGKPPPVLTTPPAGQNNSQTRFSFSKQSSPAMQATQKIQMVRTESSSLMNVYPKTSRDQREINRNDSDSLYGSTTVANIATTTQTNPNNECNDHFTWDLSALKKFPPPIVRANLKQRENDFGKPTAGGCGEGELTSPQQTSFKGRIRYNDKWNQSPLQKHPPPIVREKLRHIKDDFGSPSSAAAAKPLKINPRDSSTWDQPPLQKFPPSVVRENLKQREHDFGKGDSSKPPVKPNPRDSSTWDQTPLINFPPSVVRENIKQRDHDFSKGDSSKPPVKPNPRDSSTWDQTPLQKFPPSVVRENLKQRKHDFGKGDSGKPPAKPNPRDSSTWDQTPLIKFPPPIVREKSRHIKDDFGSPSSAAAAKPLKIDPRDSSTWDQTPLQNYPPPIVRETMSERTEEFGSLPSPGSSGSDSFTEVSPSDRDTWDDSILDKYPPPLFRGNPKQK